MPSMSGSTAYAGAQESPRSVSLSWVHPNGMIALSFVNFLLQIVTAGIYSFWGRTEVRRRIWSGIRLNGEPLEYTGRGLELFLGFLIAFFVVIVPFFGVLVAAAILLGPNSPATIAVQIGAYVLLFLLLGLGIYRAQRYRLSRTRWRGIRGGLEGSGWGYAWTYLWTLLLVPFTLGWIIPWQATKLQRIVTNNMRFGSRPFRFTATSGPLYVPFIALWVGLIVLYGGAVALIFSILWPKIQRAREQGLEPQPDMTDFAVIFGSLLVVGVLLGIIGAWYQSRVINHFAAHTHYEGATFRADTTAGGLIWLGISNFLIVILTLGILGPVATARTARYLVEHMALDGEIDVAAITQGADQGLRTGEGLAQAFDVDAF